MKSELSRRNFSNRTLEFPVPLQDSGSHPALNLVRKLYRVASNFGFHMYHYYNLSIKHLKLLLPALFLLAFAMPAFAGPFGLSGWHPATQTTAGTFPENYTFNGTLNIFLMISAFILLYRKSWISRYVYEKDTA